jgi:hypothetical protein
MSNQVLNKVKEFWVRLVRDRDFRSRLENSSIDERNQFLENSGYSFTKEEFETSTFKVIEAKERGEFTDLTEDELVTVVGGITGQSSSMIFPMYGVPWWPIDGDPGPIIRPLYGAPQTFPK